jgi:LmbE family N-acetylglucosaminyl deacetylase
MSFDVLATGTHVHEAELGCAGTLARLARAGDKVHLYVATHSGYKDMTAADVRTAETARREGRKACRILGARLIEGRHETFHVRYDDGLIAELRRVIERHRIDTVYLPFTGDVHQDHRAVSRATLTAARHCPRLLMYRINWYDSEQPFEPRHYVDVSRTHPLKVRALKAHASEMRRTGGKWLEFVGAEDRVSGLKLGVRHAEAFQAVRYLCP